MRNLVSLQVFELRSYHSTIVPAFSQCQCVLLRVLTFVMHLPSQSELHSVVSLEKILPGWCFASADLFHPFYLPFCLNTNKTAARYDLFHTGMCFLEDRLVSERARESERGHVTSRVALTSLNYVAGVARAGPYVPVRIT